MIRFLIRWGWMLLGWIELILLSLLLYLLSFLPHERVALFYKPIFFHWCRVFVHALGVNLRLHQKNLKPVPSQYILIANHPSAFEDIGIPALFPVHSLAKIEVKDWWLVGRISEAAGTLYVTRESRESRREAAEEITRALNEGKNVALYPEGGCKGRRIHVDFLYGAFDISLKTGVPILPVFLHYESQDDFCWGPGVPLVHKIWDFMTTRNNQVNYYLYDAFDPADFEDKESYKNHVYDCFLKWQGIYLE
ncbi:MAG: lysophospholipid acyltransferase family protein [Sedimenticola sp.]